MYITVVPETQETAVVLFKHNITTDNTASPVIIYYKDGDIYREETVWDKKLCVNFLKYDTYFTTI